MKIREDVKLKSEKRARKAVTPTPPINEDVINAYTGLFISILFSRDIETLWTESNKVPPCVSRTMAKINLNDSL